MSIANAGRQGTAATEHVPASRKNANAVLPASLLQSRAPGIKLCSTPFESESTFLKRQEGPTFFSFPLAGPICRLMTEENRQTHEATQKIHRRKVKARRETIEAMMEVPRARMKKMYAPPKIRLNRDTKSVNLTTSSSRPGQLFLACYSTIKQQRSAPRDVLDVCRRVRARVLCGLISCASVSFALRSPSSTTFPNWQADGD